MWDSDKPKPPSVVATSRVEETASGLRFTLHDVTMKESNGDFRCDGKKAFSALVGSSFMACSFDNEDSKRFQRIFASFEMKQPLIMSAFKAYAQHSPLIISPDAVWLTILQGFAHHINLDPEKYRSKLVDHKEGKKELISLAVPDCKGEIDWPSLFEDFCRKLGEAQKSSRIANWALKEFSTTGPIERAAFQVALMDVMKYYHDYVVAEVCGIPSIELTGTVEDWQDIYNRIDMLGEFDLDWWTKSLKPICGKFLEAAQGNIDLGFWNGIVKTGSTYGTKLYDGWFVKLIPYLVGSTGEPKYRNRLLEDKKYAVRPDSLPKGVSVVPVKLFGKDKDAKTIEFIAGFAGVSESDAGALKAEMGWAVRERASLTQVLDTLESRGLLEPVREKNEKERSGISSDWEMSADIVEITARCTDGARLCTKSGKFCGRLFAPKEYTVSRYVALEPLCDDSKTAFRTKKRCDWRRICEATHPDYGYVGSWTGIGEVDGKTFAVEMFKPNKIVLFDEKELASKDKFEVVEGKSLTQFLHEILARD